MNDSLAKIMANFVNCDPSWGQYFQREGERIQRAKHLRMIDDIKRAEIRAMRPLTHKIYERHEQLSTFLEKLEANPFHLLYIHKIL